MGKNRNTSKRSADKHSLLWAGAAPVLAALALLMAWVVHPRFNFNRWDNFEVFTPTSIYAHQLWLSGHIPLINIHQNLGEAIMGNGQSGALYFPFTLGLWVLNLFGVASSALPNLMAFFHFPLAALGWFLFLRIISITNGLAAMGALSLVSSGFFISGASIWQHIGIEYAWFPLPDGIQLKSKPVPAPCFSASRSRFFLCSPAAGC